MLKPQTLFQKGQVNLTRSQTKVLNFICKYPDKAVFMTAAQIGRELNVADSTVVRLAYPLGFESFQELKQHLRSHYLEQLDTVSRMERTIADISSIGDVLDAIFQADQANLARTRESLSREDFDRTVKVISQAEEIHILGLRSAYSMSHFLGHALEFLNRRVHLLIPGIRDIWSVLSRLGRDSVLVSISLPRHTRLTVEATKTAHQTGATVISLTDSAMSPLAPYSDIVFPVYYRLDSFVESYVAVLSLINALVTGVALLDGPQTMVRLKTMEQIWKKKGVYHSAPEAPLPSWIKSPQKTLTTRAGKKSKEEVK
ncbi:MAG: MurR/RpiR family transcriptional regulator [Thermodesulfobacteriota bacterium]